MAVSPPPVSISLSHSLPPSSPGAGPSAPPSSSSSTDNAHIQNKTFRRLRTSLEHTIRAAAGSRTRKISQSELSASSSQQSPRTLDKKLRHKHSTSDSAFGPPPSSSSMAPPADKGKQRASVDFVGVERTRERERERERVQEQERDRGGTGERTATARFSAGVGGGLRKLNSKVGLRRLSSREANHADAPPSSTQQMSTSTSTSVSGPAKLRKDRDRTVRDRPREKENKPEPSMRTRSKSPWSYFAPSLTSHPSLSASVLDVSTSTSSTEPIQRARTRENEREKETVRAAAPPLPRSPPQLQAPTPPSPTRPSRTSTSRSRGALTSPSSPALSSPTSSTSPSSLTTTSTPTTTPSPGAMPTTSAMPSPPALAPRVRSRPDPIKPSAPPTSTSTSASSSSSPHTLTRSNTTPVPPRSVPALPTTPNTSTGTTSQIQTPRNASPVPSRISRPPLSPSAGANAASRIRIRTSAGSSSANGAAGSGVRSVSTTSLPMEPSSLSSSATLSDRSERDRGEKPERPERRRPSVGSATTVTANGNGTGTGRTTPTGGVPSHAAPTSSSRARAGSTRERSLDREREKERERQMTRSRASTSASSLALSRGEVARSRSPSQSGGTRRPTSPTPLRGPSPAPLVPPGQRDTIRHAASLLLRELNGPRPRAIPRSPSAPSSQPSSPLQALFPSSISASGLAQEAWTPEVWDECEARLRLLARAERVRVGGPYGGSATSLTSVGASSSVSAAGEERERKVFAEAIRDGYVLCQLVNKLRPGTIPRVDPYEDGFKTSANATKFLAAAAGAFSLPASELFQRDDLIRGTPDALFRIARAVVAVVARAGEDAAADRVARKILLGGGGIAKEQGSSSKGQGANNSPYGTRAKAASSSTPNLSTLQRSASPPALGGVVGVSPSPKKKRWSPPSPALSTVPAEDTGSGTVSPERAGSSKAGSAQGTKGRASEKAGSGSSSGNKGVRPKARSTLKATFEDESALLTDTDTAENEGEDDGDGDEEDEEDGDEMFFDSRERQNARALPAIAPKPPPKPVPGPVRASVASEATQTTQSTAPSSLLAAGRPSDSTGGGERASQQFGTMRTATTIATSVLSDQYRGDVSAPPSEASVSVSHWDELSTGSAHSSSFVIPPLLKKPPIRDRRPSEAAMNDLTRVAEEAEDGTLHVSRDVSGDGSGGVADAKRRPQAIQLGKGKWPEDFVQAFSPGSPPRPIALHRGDTERGLSSSPLAASPPRLQLLANVHGNDSAESLPQLAPRRPTHRPRHSIDAPVLRPKELSFGREASPAPEGTAVPRIVPRRSNSANRHGVYIPRSDSASPSPSPEPAANTRVPFPRAVSGEQAVLATTTASGAEVSATTAAASAAQQSRFSRGRFQSEVDAGTRRRPRPNSYDELGAKPHRSRIESMASLGGASSSNFSASDIRSSMDGSAMRKTLIIRDEGRPSTHFQLGNCIGRGQFGSVYRALNLNTGQMVAVKRIRLEGLSEDDVKQLMREVDVVKSLSHPSIVKYEGMSRDSDTLNIVLEYAENGSLGQTLKAFGKLNEKLVATYVIKILEGLDYLHRNDVVHCDLKAANILTTKTGNVKLSDFGVSLNLRKVGNTHKSDVTGTPNWMAPEVIELKGASRASDIWSLGCTVIELLTGRPPYAEILNSMSVMYRIVDDAMPPIPDDWTPLLKDFLQQCFQREPADRPSAEVLSEHEWLKEHCEIHKVLRPKESIPFLRRVSQDLQQRPDAVRFLGVNDVPRSDSRASSDQPRRSEDGSASPATSGLPGSPPRKRLSAGPTTPKSPESEVSVSVAREHSFVKTAFGKPLLCRVCMQPVKKHAVVCEECSLIAHAHCAPNAPQTCGFRAQLLQYANYSPAPESPNALEILRQFTPSGSPAAESVLAAHHSHTPIPEAPPPTAFKMFNAFRRSRSSLSPDQDRSRKRAISMSQTSGEGSSESVLASQPVGQPIPIPRTSRSGVLLKPPRARPISTSSENTTQNRGSQRSAETAGSIDLSDDSYSQAHSHSHSHSQSTMYTYSRSQSALPSPTQVLARSRSRGRSGTSGVSSPLGAGSDGETETEADGVRYSRFSVAASAADSTDPRRASVLAGSSVGGSYDDHEENDELERRAWRRKPRRSDGRQGAGGEKEKGCVLQ